MSEAEVSPDLGLVPSPQAALIVVDVQNDFCPGGALAVPNGDEVVPVINQWVEWFHQRRGAVLFSQDWHPAHHVSFRERGGPWPPHCVQESWGAQLHPALQVGRAQRIIKGTHPDHDAYSAFEGHLDPGPPDTPVADYLRRLGVQTVLVVGLATDYCVKATAEHALASGFTVFIDPAACRAVNVEPLDGQQALADLVRQGAVSLRH